MQVTIELKITNPFRRISHRNKTNTNNRKTIFSNYIQYWIRSLYARFQLFMDGGKSSWAKSKKSVLKTVKNAGNLTKSYDPEFALIEEVDLNSTRSYHVNEYSILKKCLKNYDTVFAQNYDSAFLFYPFTQPHGSSKAGLALFSRYPIKDSLRRSLPISTSYNKFLI